MKKTVSFIFLTLTVMAGANAQSLADKLIHHEQSYLQFLVLGKGACTDHLNRKLPLKAFEKHFDTLSHLKFPLALFYREDNLKHELQDFQKRELPGLVQKFRQKDEKFSVQWSPLLVCEQIFSVNEKTRAAYAAFVSDSRNRNSNKGDLKFLDRDLQAAKWDKF